MHQVGVNIEISLIIHLADQIQDSHKELELRIRKTFKLFKWYLKYASAAGAHHKNCIPLLAKVGEKKIICGTSTHLVRNVDTLVIKLAGWTWIRTR